jgi:hypothetical protein
MALNEMNTDVDGSAAAMMRSIYLYRIGSSTTMSRQIIVWWFELFVLFALIAACGMTTNMVDIIEETRKDRS